MTARLLPTDEPLDLAGHLAAHGPLPRDPGDLGPLVEASGLLGRGGAGFPTGRKLRAVRQQRRRPVVVANAAEGEPASAKDATLLRLAPHLVLDGLHLVADAVRATDVVLWTHGAVPARAFAERDRRTRVVRTPRRFVAGESSAVVAGLEGREPKPRTSPPRPSERGVHGRPTLVCNVETLAHIALIARHGPEWFRCVGDPSMPGTMLLTIGGAVDQPGVLEVATGTPIGTVLDRAHADPRTTAVLVGGYHGGWLDAATARGTPLTHQHLRAAGAALGAGIVAAITDADCGLAETARVLRYLAAESAGQCGPCLFGLPAIADAFTRLATGTGDTRPQLARWTAMVRGRGACSHPDGTATLAESALRTFRADAAAHAAGAPCRRHARNLLPT